MVVFPELGGPTTQTHCLACRRARALQTTELRAKALLAHPPTAKKVEKLGAVQFALGGILGVHDLDGTRVIPDRKRVLIKVLTLLMYFSDAIDRTPCNQSSNSPTIKNRQ